MIGPLSLQGGDTKVIIDCHWHVLFDDYERVIQTSINELKRCGMDRCALMFHLDLYQKEGDLHRQGEALKKVLKDRKEYFVPFLTVDPNVDFGIVKEGVEEYVVKGPAVAVKVHHSMKADRKEFEPLANLLSMHGIPVLIHCWYKTVQKYENESDPSNIANLAAKFPDLKIIMAHILSSNIKNFTSHNSTNATYKNNVNQFQVHLFFDRNYNFLFKQSFANQQNNLSFFLNLLYRLP
jgi:hypothetical protein